jgi:hypothetical protein
MKYVWLYPIGCIFLSSRHVSSNIRTVRELGGWGSQVPVTLHRELREGGCCFVMCVFWQLCGSFGNTGSADSSLARPGMERARKNIRDARYFVIIETRADIKFFPARQGAEGNSNDSDRNISLFNCITVFCIVSFIYIYYFSIWSRTNRIKNLCNINTQHLPFICKYKSCIALYITVRRQKIFHRRSGRY